MATNRASMAFPDADLSLAASAGVYADIQHFLSREAVLLDHRRFDEWTALLANDVVFLMAPGFSRELGMQTPAASDWFQHDHRAITVRIKRMQNESLAGQQQLATRTRRFITNVVVCPCGRDEYHVLSYLLLTTSKPGASQSEVFSAERHDRLRRSTGTFKIVRREIVMDQRTASLDMDMYV